ncbi:hypothetical protein BS47DRAFT_1389367 [Hydnum rufescens UP504]|uniref:Uncharacterized protein n=1 Tax=Hydnum rufescens UP504 TaxID=1448309 RepID=A0A9P6B5R0_9AGAM|nr:hypothetical protein BS47DRAFT_1389367 [Hydnum rufescens UP504]
MRLARNAFSLSAGVNRMRVPNHSLFESSARLVEVAIRYEGQDRGYCVEEQTLTEKTQYTSWVAHKGRMTLLVAQQDLLEHHDRGARGHATSKFPGKGPGRGVTKPHGSLRADEFEPGNETRTRNSCLRKGSTATSQKSGSIGAEGRRRSTPPPNQRSERSSKIFSDRRHGGECPGA